MLTVNQLYPCGQPYQFWQLLPVTLMVALQNVGDQCFGGRLVCSLIRIFCLLQDIELCGDRLRVQAATNGGVLQAFVPTTAEVQTILIKKAGGTGNGSGQSAQRLFENVHDARSLKVYDLSQEIEHKLCQKNYYYISIY